MDIKGKLKMKQYYRLCDGLNTKGKLIPTTENLDNYLTVSSKDYYLSLYKYNSTHKKHFDEHNTVSGIVDTVTDVLLWDFDSVDFEAVRSDTLTLVERLNDKGIGNEDIELYFSGNKGTHVIVSLNKDITPAEFKHVTKNLAVDLSTYDSSVSNPSRIVRIENTKHNKSGLFKVPLSYEQVKSLDVDKIKEFAKSPKQGVYNQNKVNVPKIVPVPVVPRTPSEDVSEELELNYDDKPKWISHWKYALLHGYFPSGCRSNALMILAATYRGQGLPKTVTYHALKGAAELQSNRFDEDKFSKDEIYNNIIEQVYAPTWNKGTYAEDNFPVQLKKYLQDLGVPRKEETSAKEQQIELVENGFSDFAKYAKDIDKYTMKFGINQLDSKLKIRKGHLIGLLAGPGIGKTAISLKILNNMSKEDTHCYFASLDMFKHNVYQKLIQKHTGLNEDDIFKFFVDKDVKKIEEFKKVLVDNYKNVSFCFKSGQSISEIKQSIQIQEEKMGKTVELVVVDYLELILSKYSDATAASAEAIQGLREISNEGRVVVVLLQPNKISSRPNEPLLSYNAAKGSSAIAQAVTAMLTAHRPGLSSDFPEEDHYFSINCVKNRNGPLFALDFGWKGPTQDIYELEDAERRELKDLRQRVKDRKDNKETDGGF